QEFLYYALDGEFTENILKFQNRLTLVGEIEREILSGLFYGETSGLDFLWGFIWTIEHLVKSNLY
ncbi:MAG: hypothetical protein ACXAC7_14530, partial [Candidatus Hodarchaeales archaeon]